MLVISIGISSKAQTYEWRYGGLKLGYNLGASWQKSDIRTNRLGFTQGWTLGFALYEKPRKFFYVDLRGRYMNSTSYGLSSSRLSASDSFNLPSEVRAGYNPSDSIFFNHRTKMYEGDLELVIGLNRLREATGINLYGWGGLGVGGYRTMTEQFDWTGNKYDYSTIVTAGRTRAEIFDQLNTMYSNGAALGTRPNFETATLGYSANTLKYNFVPSLGLGIGFRVTRWWQVGFEHKVSFPYQEDRLDGYMSSDFKRYDRLHYTSFFTTISMGGRVSGNHRHNQEPNDNPVVVPSPEIRWIYPNPNGQNVTSNTYAVVAEVKNVSNSDNIIFRVNDQIVPFTFSNNTLTATVALRNGRNDFTILATNKGGNASSAAWIAKNVDPQTNITLPEIIWETPNTSGVSVTNQMLTWQARVKNVSGKRDLTVKFNGDTILGYSFNSVSGLLEYPSSLNPQINTLEIIAKNQAGMVRDSSKVIYSTAIPKQNQLPTVTITQPGEEVYQTTRENVNVKALITNVTAASQVRVFVNEAEIRSFNFDLATGSLSMFVDVNSRTVVRIVAKNTAGQGSDFVTLKMLRPIDPLPNMMPPTVMLINPTGTGERVSAAAYTVTARLTNVRSSEQLKFYMNGVRVTSFVYSAASGQFTANVNLVAGNNDFRLVATNSDGTAEDMASVFYEKSTNTALPTVRFTNPSVSPTRYVNAFSSYTYRAAVTGVNRRTQIKVYENGSETYGFNFDATTKEVSGTLFLNDGANNIEVVATNEIGTARATAIINYSRDNEDLAPKVTIIDPAQNPFTVPGTAYEVVAKVENVKYRSEIDVTVGGRPFYTYSYESNTNLVKINANNLPIGNTLVTINVKTKGGTDRAEVTLVRGNAQPVGLAPTVSITRPVGNPFNTSTKTCRVEAVVGNSNASTALDVRFNGYAYTSYQFNATTGIFSADVTLNSGRNTFEITASNANGRASDDVAMVYTPTVPTNPALPTVSIVKPTQGAVFSTATQAFEATVSNITSSSQVDLTLNGTSIQGITMSGTTVRANLTLIKGSNVIAITVRNAAGSASDSKTVSYTIPTPIPTAPTVVIQTPTQNQVFTSSLCNLSATVLNAKASEIEVLVNGSKLPVFNYVSTSGALTINFNLVKGSNTVQVKATTPAGSAADSRTITYNAPQTAKNPPVVTIVRPSSGTISQDKNIQLGATVTNVTSQNQVTVKLNGSNIPFTLNTSLGTIVASVTLANGRNSIEVIATNNDGTGSASTSVSYTEPVVTQSAPVVRVIIPSGGTGSTTSSEYTAEFSVQYIDQASQISVEVNNVATTVFTFDAENAKVSVPINPNVGRNTVKVTVTNAAGSDNKTATINYTYFSNPPVITWVNPVNGRGTATNMYYQIQASVTNVNAKNQITVKLNGNPIPFSYDLTNQLIEANITLGLGNNTLQITATNNAGSDVKNGEIMNDRGNMGIAPGVTITRPGLSSVTVTSDTFMLIGGVVNVNSDEEITLTLNNRPVTFTYSLTNSTLKANLRLVTGLNYVVLSAANNNGSDSKTIQITYDPQGTPNEAPKMKQNNGTGASSGKSGTETNGNTEQATVPAPELTINVPFLSTVTTTSSTTSIRARTRNITDASQITFSVNGSTTTAFNFNPANGLITANIGLNKGSNIVTITVKNSAGTASKMVTINRVEEQQPAETPRGGRTNDAPRNDGPKSSPQPPSAPAPRPIERGGGGIPMPKPPVRTSPAPSSAPAGTPKGRTTTEPVGF